tara:strand:+ start:276 stop:941 length:666 start_codon:yes stop_codon:yes gene_type:complete
MPRKLIGIFGGAFDPVHNGHSAITKYCIEKLCMEKIIVVPTGTSPLNKKLTNDNFRLEMLHKVFHEDCYEISEYEVLQSKKNNDPTYTIDTLKYLTARDEQTSYAFIMGMDSLLNLHQWFQWESLLNYCHFIVIQRKGNNVDLNTINPLLSNLIKKNTALTLGELSQNGYGGIYFAKFPLMPISSTEIRKKLSQDRDVSGLVSPEIEKYSKEFKIYHSEGQ